MNFKRRFFVVIFYKTLKLFVIIYLYIYKITKSHFVAQIQPKLGGLEPFRGSYIQVVRNFREPQ
jgi:hypothetical protein